MNNPWTKIKLEDYENHMSLPDIKQAQYLSNYLKEITEKYEPDSLAIIGCAGGNGLENIDSKTVEKVICVDINSEFIIEVEKRFRNSFKNIEFICEDINSEKCKFEQVDLIFVGLVFEYVNFSLAIKKLSGLIKPKGILAVVLQLPNENIPEVSPSPYTSLEILSDVFSFVPLSKFKEASKEEGFELISENVAQLESGKEFCELGFQRIKY